MISVNDAGRRAAFGELSQFRQELYASLRRRADALYDAVNSGVVEVDRLRRAIIGLPPGSRNKHVRAHPPVGETQHQNATTSHDKRQKV